MVLQQKRLRVPQGHGMRPPTQVQCACRTAWLEGGAGREWVTSIPGLDKEAVINRSKRACSYPGVPWALALQGQGSWCSEGTWRGSGLLTQNVSSLVLRGANHTPSRLAIWPSELNSAENTYLVQVNFLAP